MIFSFLGKWTNKWNIRKENDKLIKWHGLGKEKGKNIK